NAQLAEASDILGGQQLRVLDALAQAEWLPVFARLLEGVECVAVRAIADRMHGDREAGPCRGPDQAGEVLAARGLDAPAVEQPRGLGAERAIHEDLQVAEPQPWAADAARDPEGRERVRALRRERLPDPQRQGTLGLEPLPEPQRSQPTVL